MEQPILVEKLCGFGLTRQEACVYLCLHRNGELTGYEAAKHTGISRSNVYTALSGLVEKGAAYLVEGSSSKYIPVPVDEFSDNKICALKEDRDFLIENIPHINEARQGYITIEGYKHIIDKMRHMLRDACSRVYLSAPEYFIRRWREELLQAVGRDIKLVLITDQDPGIQGSILYTTHRREPQLRLIIDSHLVLTGDITGKDTDTCLYCGQVNFVNVFKEALRNEMKLIELNAADAPDTDA